MQSWHWQVLAAFVIILIVATTGCVAPPKEVIKPTITPSTGKGGSSGSVSTPTPTPTIIAEATPYIDVTTEPLDYTRFTPTTPIPEDMVCLISLTAYNWTFESGSAAKSITLLNPPMYINYSITKPFNVSGQKFISSKTDASKDKMVSYSYYSPSAYLDITVRNKDTGTILLQDGFGKKNGYTLNRTIRVPNAGNLLIEFKGNNITPTVGIWVKHSQNINATISTQKMLCYSQEYVKKLLN